LERVERTRFGEKRYRVEKTKMKRMNKDCTERGKEGKSGNEKT
jgi:hypothetical protein